MSCSSRLKPVVIGQPRVECMLPLSYLAGSACLQRFQRIVFKLSLLAQVGTRLTSVRYLPKLVRFLSTDLSNPTTKQLSLLTFLRARQRWTRKLTPSARWN
jgi:hypothetical protein